MGNGDGGNRKVIKTCGRNKKFIYMFLLETRCKKITEETERDWCQNNIKMYVRDRTSSLMSLHIPNHSWIFSARGRCCKMQCLMNMTLHDSLTDDGGLGICWSCGWWCVQVQSVACHTSHCSSHAAACTSCITQNTIESGGMIRGFVMFQCFGRNGGSDLSGLRCSSLPLSRMCLWNDAESATCIEGAAWIIVLVPGPQLHTDNTQQLGSVKSIKIWILVANM